ncbi:MAG: 23S rRNA (pseudouridine(1915)-N(3))-methyltransferase RlmH [Woeseiaceae bacterium]|nr:23S rRNA (pseudouridine(1915)-N(3))-methyltransferase RlmH [Woeseiaceae bacterium]
MHLRLLAVGDRQPGWVDDAFQSYAGRLPRDWRFRLDAIPTARRGKSDAGDRAVADEGERLLAKLGRDERLVLLDERGQRLTSKALAERLQEWQSDGRDVAFVIGGPDGVSADVRGRADATLSLSDLTLPHGLARVLLAEQLYRAWSLAAGHPYHRA